MTDQAVAIALIQEGYNVLLSGGAGVGKSYIIGQINDNHTVLAAPTGIAALNIGGETCHSLFNLPFGLVTDEDRNKNPKKVAELFSTDYIKRLIIDEISMVRADYLDLIDYRLRRVKMNNKPFGGIQVVVVGDFYQLPPIVARKEARHFKKMYDSPYAFDSKVWQEANFNPVLLQKVYRQSDEQQIALLNAVRMKTKHWKHAVDRLNEWCPQPTGEDELVLCNYKDDADFVNRSFYKRIDGDEVTYRAEITGNFKENDCIVDPKINLKEGVKVVLCANCPNKTYRNGQRGTVVTCEEKTLLVRLDDDDSIVLVEPHKWERIKYSKLMGSLTKIPDGTFKQLPVRLGWGLTVHKAQGMTLDKCSYNLGRKSFAPHQTYVGLSRIRDLTQMGLTRPIERDDIIVDERVKRFYESITA